MCLSKITLADDFSTVYQCECKWNTNKLLPVYCIELQSVNVCVMSEKTSAITVIHWPHHSVL
jgi:hypothetical protein